MASPRIVGHPPRFETNVQIVIVVAIVDVAVARSQFIVVLGGGGSGVVQNS